MHKLHYSCHKGFFLKPKGFKSKLFAEIRFLKFPLSRRIHYWPWILLVLVTSAIFPIELWKNSYALRFEVVAPHSFGMLQIIETEHLVWRGHKSKWHQLRSRVRVPANFSAAESFSTVHNCHCNAITIMDLAAVHLPQWLQLFASTA